MINAECWDLGFYETETNELVIAGIATWRKMASERLEEGIQFCNGYLWLIFMELQQELGEAIKVKTNKE